MDSIAYFNGRFISEGQAKLSLRDVGIVWGATATDRVRTYRRRYYCLAEHLARFRRSCELCRIPLPPTEQDLSDLAEQLLESNGLSVQPEREIVLVMLATPGQDLRDRPDGSLCLYTEPLEGERYRPLLERGARLITPPTRHVPDLCIPRQAKMRSRLFWWIAEEEARTTDPSASALLLDLDGFVTETASANFLIVRQGEVISPPASDILDGISRRVVEQLCRKHGIPFSESRLTLPECESADEALLTSTPFGIAGVSSLNGRPIPWPGKILRQLIEAWSESIGVSVHTGIASSS